MASLRARKPQELIPLEFTQINKPFAFSSSLAFSNLRILLYALKEMLTVAEDLFHHLSFRFLSTRASFYRQTLRQSLRPPPLPPQYHLLLLPVSPQHVHQERLFPLHHRLRSLLRRQCSACDRLRTSLPSLTSPTWLLIYS
jgi:hypothetical protein